MKLTAELLLSAPSYINPIKDRELLLRGHKIPAIENLGVTRDLNDVIDLTDNDIRSLGNFPVMPRLKGLLVSRNKISYIEPNFASTLPNLHTLVLSSNTITQLADLDPISGFSKLTFLSVIDNPVTLQTNYRLYVIWRNPHVRILDYQKVTDSERQQVVNLFGSISKPTAYASQITGLKSKTFDVLGSSGTSDNQIVGKLTVEEKAQLREDLKRATSLAEIEKIEAALKRGYF